MRYSPVIIDESKIPPSYVEAMKLWQNKQLIDVIVRNMRGSKNVETFTPEEGQVHYVSGLVMPITGGIVTSYVDEKGNFAPDRKGYSYDVTAEKVADMKRIIVALLYGVMNVRGKWILGLFYLLFRKRLKESFWRMVWQLREMIIVHLIMPIRYCVSVREVHKAFGVFTEERMKWVRDIVCMILEFDDAYRYRFQDVMGEFSPDSFKKDSEKEIKRLFNFILQREEDPRINHMWKSVSMVISLLFITHRFEIEAFFSQLNPENMKLDEDDFYYAKVKPGYNWFRNNGIKINLLPSVATN